MTDFVLSAETDADFATAAAQLGFVDQHGEIVVQGPLPDGSGTYLLTDPQLLMVPTGRMVESPMDEQVAEMASDGKVYRGLRINGNNPFASGMPIPAQLTVYPTIKYLADGVTPDPDYAPPNVGRIA